MNVIISGTRGEGKSTLSLYLARQFADTVVIWDPRGTFAGVGIECLTIDDLFDALIDKQYLISASGPKPLVLRLDDIKPSDFGDAMKRIFPMYFNFKGKISIIIDEARELQSPHWIEPQLNRLIRQSPLHRVLIVQNTHQLMDWNSATKSVTDDIYMFRQIGPRNYKVVTEHLGEHVAEICATLPKHHLCHCWFDNRGDDNNFEVWDDPTVWYTALENSNVSSEMPVMQAGN